MSLYFTYNMDNLSRIDLSWKNPYLLLEGHLVVKIAIGIFNTALIGIGIAFYTAAYLYEKYGLDPQKRGILNQVIKVVTQF